MPQQAQAGSAFEFTEKQNQTVRVLANRMRFVGVFLIIFGALYAVVGFVEIFSDRPFDGYFDALLAVPLILIGVWTMRGAGSFKLIVDTEGDDIAHLDNALESLRHLYGLAFWVLVFAIALAVLVFIMGVIGGLMVIGSGG